LPTGTLSPIGTLSPPICALDKPISPRVMPPSAGGASAPAPAAAARVLLLPEEVPHRRDRRGRASDEHDVGAFLLRRRCGARGAVLGRPARGGSRAGKLVRASRARGRGPRHHLHLLLLLLRLLRLLALASLSPSLGIEPGAFLGVALLRG
jgi:hypothetical protein